MKKEKDEMWLILLIVGFFIFLAVVLRSWENNKERIAVAALIGFMAVLGVLFVMWSLSNPPAALRLYADGIILLSIAWWICTFFVVLGFLASREKSRLHSYWEDLIS